MSDALHAVPVRGSAFGGAFSVQHRACYNVGMPTFLYEIAHRASGRRYIGITESAPSQRWHGHKCDARKGRGSRIARAIAKHGAAAFDWLVLAAFPTRAAAISAEIAVIRDTRPEYNLTAGGEGARGFKHSDAAKAAMRGPRPGLARKCRARAQTAAGRAHLDAIRYKGGREPGWAPTPETVARMSASAKARISPAFLAMNAGRVASAETRAKLSAVHLRYPPGTRCDRCEMPQATMRGHGLCKTCYAREYARARRATTRRGPGLPPEVRANMARAQQARRRREAGSG